jgi:hypothetical protein
MLKVFIVKVVLKPCYLQKLVSEQLLLEFANGFWRTLSAVFSSLPFILLARNSSALRSSSAASTGCRY